MHKIVDHVLNKMLCILGLYQDLEKERQNSQIPQAKLYSYLEYYRSKNNFER